MTSWLGSLWGGSHSSSLPYNINNDPLLPSTRHGSHGWAIHSATRKSDGGEVTAFQASKVELSKTQLRGGTNNLSLAEARYTDTSQLTQLIPALHHFHRIKRLIHPRILRTHATLDTDYPDESKPSAPGLEALDKCATTGTLIIITEQVTPLDEWLENLNPHTSPANAAAVSWGIHNLVEALDFLHTQAKLAHGMVNPDSVFVTPAGDFKLGGFDLITPVGIEDGGGGPTPHFRKYEGHVCPSDYRSPERLGQRYDILQQSAPVHAMDCYSLAVLIEYIYSHPNAGTSGQVPAPLKKAIVRMKNDAPKLRPRLAPLLKCPVFDNPHVKAETFLDEVMSKPIEEKIMFLQSLPDVLNRGILNQNVAIHKILPLLVMGLHASAGNEAAMTQDVNRREVLAIVPLLFQIAESYLAKSPELFQRHITPLVPLLFAINDRGVRGVVLQKISLLEGHLDKTAINSSVFEPMCSGFTDSSAPLRELTLKSTIVLVPKLNHANTEKLVRYLIRLQSDPEASIRTNTVIFIGKIAPNLTEMSRQKLILPAFMRSMKDPFMPCRLSALRAIVTCKEYFTQKDLADKVLPAVAPHTLDAANDVRKEAFNVVEIILVGLRAESERMAKDEADRISAATCGMSSVGGDDTLGGGIPAPPSSGSYLSGLSTWMTTNTTPSQPAEATPRSSVAGKNVGAGNNAMSGSSSAVPSKLPGPAAPKFSSLSLSDAQIGGGGGWSDDDNDDIGSSSPIRGKSSDGWGDDNLGSPGKMMDDDDGDFFSSFGSSAKPTIPAGGHYTTRSNGTNRLPSSQRTGLSLTSKAAPQMQASSGLKIKKQAKPAVQKLTGTDILDDGWDDF